MKAKPTILTAMLMASGIAIACGDPLPLPIPPTPINIIATDLARSLIQGYSKNPAYAALMKKIDSLGSSAVGSNSWRQNSYAGYVTYSVSAGSNMIFVQKGCDRNFIDDVEKNGNGNGGGGGGISSCDPTGGMDYGIVGWVEHAQPYTVCTSGNCTSGVYYEYEPIYGSYSSGGVC